MLYVYLFITVSTNKLIFSFLCASKYLSVVVFLVVNPKVSSTSVKMLGRLAFDLHFRVLLL